MSENQRSTADEAEGGLNTASDLGSQSIQKGLPRRPNRESNPSGASGSNAPSPSISPSDTGPPPSGKSSSNSDSGNGDHSPDGPQDTNPQPNMGNDHSGYSGTPDGGTNTPGSDNPNNRTGSQGSEQTPSGRNSAGAENTSNPSDPNSSSGTPEDGSPDADYGSSGFNNGSSGTSGSESAGVSSRTASAGAAEAGSGAAVSGGSTAAGGSAGASAGAAAGSGATAGAAASAGGGAAAGATVGTLGGPVGMAVGALAGALLGPLLKFIGMAIAVVFVLITFFMMIPSFLFDNSSATNDRVVLENTYNYYYSHIQSEYQKDIQSQMSKAGWTTTSISLIPITLANIGFYNSLWEAPSGYPYVSISEEDKVNILAVTGDDSYNEVEFTASTAFLQSAEQYLENASSNINLVMSMIDVQKRHWLISLFEGIADSITGGWYSRFTDWISKKWDGFWNDFITYDLFSVTMGEVTIETRTRWIDVINSFFNELTGETETSEDKEEEAYTVAVINIVYTYDLKDLGVGYYASKLNLTDKEIDRAAEMANNLGNLFDSHSNGYFGWYVQGGYHTGAVQGGGVGVNIANALEKLSEQLEGMEFDPGSDPQVFPLVGFSNLPMSSPYGPRNFAADPWHTGIDFSAAAGVPIRPIADGVVLFTAQMPNGFGNYIAVYHGDHDGQPVTTVYAHMSAFGTFNAGDAVNSSRTLGYVGRTGLSTGNHLHFEIHIGGSRYNPVEVLDVFSYLRP